MQKIDKIKETLISIHSLLVATTTPDWAIRFSDCINAWEMAKSESEKKSVARKIYSIYGGMGSFNDLVLFKESKVLREENSRLDDLRKTLFAEVIHAIRS